MVAERTVLFSRSTAATFFKPRPTKETRLLQWPTENLKTGFVPSSHQKKTGSERHAEQIEYYVLRSCPDCQFILPQKKDIFHIAFPRESQYQRLLFTSPTPYCNYQEFLFHRISV